MYIPRQWHFAGPVSLVLTGFAINQQLYGGGLHLDTALLVQLPLNVIAAQWGAYIWKAGEVWQKFEAGWDAPRETPQPRPQTVPVNSDGKTIAMVYTQVTEAPRLDAERKFARSLIAMRNSNLEVNLKESYWLEKIGGNNRYGEPRDNFVAMKSRWERNRVIARVGERKNATYQVIDWRKVRLVADGLPLPIQ